MILRRISIVLMLASALALLMGSVGFSTIAADRGVNVNVASDDHAYVGYDTNLITVETENGTGSKDYEELVKVDNRFTANLDVVSVETEIKNTDDITIDVTEKPTGIEPGEASHIEGDIDCDSGDTDGIVSMTIRVETTTNSVASELDGDTDTREFEVDCDPQGISVEIVEYNGLGSFEIQSDQTGKVQATVWVWEKNGDEQDQITATFKTNEKISRADIKKKSSLSFDNNNGQGNDENFDIVAVELSSQENVDTTATGYIHPQWHKGGFKNGKSGGDGCPVYENIDESYLESHESCDQGDEPGNSNSSR